MSNTDWTGNSRSAHAILGARNYAHEDRQTDDYYATEPKAAVLLMDVEKFSPMIWECACGEGHLSKEFEKAGYQVYSTDLIDRGYGGIQDFLSSISPPYPVSTSSRTRLTNMLRSLWITLWRLSIPDIRLQCS